MNDHDADLRRLLDDHVDGIVGPERAAPPFEPTGTAGADSTGGRPRWIVLAVSALAAAAAVAVAAVAVTQWTVRTDPSPRIAAPPSPSAPATSPAAPASTPGPDASSRRPTSSTSSATGTPAVPPSSQPPPSGTPTSAGGARWVLPAGWTVTPRTGTVFAASWCLQPAGEDCTILLSRHDPDGQQALDVDIQGGLAANPQYCEPTADNRTTGETGVRNFGGREAEWRRWTITCGDTGRTVDVEQYVVATDPGYVLYSDRADPEVAAVMAEVAATAELPDQLRPLRLTDRGIIRSVQAVGDGIRITLDRVYLDPADGRKVINNNPATFTYLVPAQALSSTRTQPAIGEQISLSTDGTRVTTINTS